MAAARARRGPWGGMMSSTDADGGRGGDRTDEQGLQRDRALCRRAARQDRSAFAELYERHAESVRNLLLTRGAPQDEVWDLVQETFTRALRALDRGRAPDRFDLWIRRIALNVRTDHWRTPHLRHEQSTDPWALPEETTLDPDGSTAELMRASVQSLTPQLRDAVILHFYQDLGVREVAAVLRIPPGTVKSRLSRAYRQLASRVADGGRPNETWARMAPGDKPASPFGRLGNRLRGGRNEA